MNSMSDQISNLSEEDQERFHAEAQRHLRNQWAEAKNRTETEIDQLERRKKNGL